jgi:secreted trypsin-like serine protease
VEVEDPATFSGTVTDTLGGDCAIGETCRWSDAALISVNNTVAKKGTIARTTGWTQYDSPVTIRSDSDSLFYIDGKTDEAAYVGLELEKLGRTTGWTLGEVITTCEDRVGEDGIVRLCSDVIDAGAQRGDSGAPVFYSQGDGWVTAYGILWGGRWPNWDRVIYSPFENIDYEFDPLNVEY